MSGAGDQGDLPALSFARSAGMPAPGQVQFFDGYFPILPAASYKIETTQKVSLPKKSEEAKYKAIQHFEVKAPRFTLDPGVAEAVFPPDGGNGEYDEELPYVVLADPSLPWERSVIPGVVPSEADPTPWLALTLFAEEEVQLQAGTSSPLTTMTVEELLSSSDEVLGPRITLAEVPEAERKSTCQAVTVKGAAFTAVMPSLEELAHLAHCRAVNNEAEGAALLSLVLGNRLAKASTKPLRFHAHLVSLEGFHEYLGPGAKQPPAWVRLASLYSWTFVSQPKAAVDFEALVKGLIAHQGTAAKLALEVPEGKQLPAPAQARIDDGYTPLAFASGAGEQGFAWYRGPFSPVVPQPLPEVGDPPVPVSEARNADALAIYLAKQGLFDLSYAAAWNAGRQRALADAKFAGAIGLLRREARAKLGLLAQRMSAPYLAGLEPAELLARDAARGRFAERVAAGIASNWTAALGGARAGRSAPPAGFRLERPRRRAAVHPREALAQAGVADALGDALEETLQTVGAWLARLSLLGSLPFDHLVPNPGLLPEESIRFFYVDRGWVDALLAGAISVGIGCEADVALMKSLRPRLAKIVAAEGGIGLDAAPRVSGVLIRSQLVSAWPGLVVQASVTEPGKITPRTLKSLRDDAPAPAVRLCLFEGVPDRVTLAEPYRGLRFGIEEGTIALRQVSGAAIGQPLKPAKTVTPQYRPPAADVLAIAELVTALAAELDRNPADLKGADLAIQLVSAPELQAFPSPTTEANG
ncbi:MAG: hypothetical protein ACTHNP_12300 [Solirubrobacterales bacterium]